MAELNNHVAAIQRYVEHGIEPGSCTRAILENDLMGAVTRADATTDLQAIVIYVINHVPAPLWGNKERVQKHIAQKRAELAQGKK